MSKHTPGPWIVEACKELGETNFRPGIDSCSANPISIVIFGDIQARDECGIHGETHEERTANANLIASSPEMYNALKEALAYLQSLSDSGDCGYWRIEKDADFIRWSAAIEKAEGRTGDV